MKMHGNSNPLVMIQSVYKSLTKTEQKIADFVLRETQESVYSSVTDLAEKADVGETSVIRFCRKIGYRGFQEFKLDLAQTLKGIDEQVHGQIEETDSPEVVAKKITAQNSIALQDTLNILSPDSLQNAEKAILSARKLYFFGVGSSGYTANDANYRFMRLGFNTTVATDAHVIAMNAALVNEEDVVVVISSSGSTKDIVDAVKIAKENKAFVICITNHARSPITNFSDVILLAATKETPLQGGAFSSKIAQLHILDILTTLIILQNQKPSLHALRKTAKAVLDKMY